MKAFEDRFGHWLLRHRWAVILVTLILLAAAASGGANLRFTTDYRVFFSADNPQLLAFESLEKTYAKSDNLLFVLAPRDGRALDRATLAAAQELTSRARNIPYSTGVDSVTNFQFSQAEGDELLVRDLVLSQSGFELNSGMGILTAMVIALVLLADFLL